MKIDTALITNPGGRTENQDYVLEKRIPEKDANCWIVADGLGGHIGGEVASRLAAEALSAEFEDAINNDKALKLNDWIEKAQSMLIEQQGSSEQLAAMRTTAVILAQRGLSAEWSHCGDSRLYWFSNGDLVVQSEDHSVPQALVKLGQILPQDIRLHEDRNRVTQCLGSPGGVTSSTNPVLDVRDGSAFILCSDGFWEYVYEPEMLIDLAKAKNAEHWLELMYGRCLERAPSDSDNCSAIVGIFKVPEGHDLALLAAA